VAIAVKINVNTVLGVLDEKKQGIPIKTIIKRMDDAVAKRN